MEEEKKEKEQEQPHYSKELIDAAYRYQNWRIGYRKRWLDKDDKDRKPGK